MSTAAEIAQAREQAAQLATEAVHAARTDWAKALQLMGASARTYDQATLAELRLADQREKTCR